MFLIQNVERKIKRNAIIKGLILGCVITALSIFSFYFITLLTRQPLDIIVVMFFCSVILPIVFSIFFCFDMRNKIGGYWSLRQAATGIFLMFLISFALLTVGRDFIFSKLIEPDMAAKVELVMVDVKQSRLKEQGAPADVIKSQIAELKNEMATPNHVSLFDVLNSYIKTIILLFAIAVIFAAIFKKELPLIVEEVE